MKLQRIRTVIMEKLKTLLIANRGEIAVSPSSLSERSRVHLPAFGRISEAKLPAKRLETPDQSI